MSVLRRDSRPPIVYLRSFSDDNAYDLNLSGFVANSFGLGRHYGLMRLLGPLANVHPLRLLRLFRGHGGDTSEEQLSVFFRNRGPFIAIGQPGEWLAKGGASRLYIGHDEWQSVVNNLLERSQIVILQPGKTEGVWWEMMQTFSNVDSRKLLVSLLGLGEVAPPPTKSFRLTKASAHEALKPKEWAEFQERMKSRLNVSLLDATGGAAFMCFEDGMAPMFLPVHYRSPLLWPILTIGVNFKKTFAPFLTRLDGQPPVPPKRASQRTLGRFAAFSLYIFLPILAWNFESTYAKYRGTDLAKSIYSDSGWEGHRGRSADYLLMLPSGFRPVPAIPDAGDFDLAYVYDSRAWLGLRMTPYMYVGVKVRTARGPSIEKLLEDTALETFTKLGVARPQNVDLAALARPLKLEGAGTTWMLDGIIVADTAIIVMTRTDDQADDAKSRFEHLSGSIFKRFQPPG